MSFTEIGDRIWTARYPWHDVNVTAVGGTGGLVVVDTHSSTEAAREVIADVQALGAGPVTALVNTHDHFDHFFGNHAFREAYGDLPIHATDTAAESMHAALTTEPPENRDDPRWPEVVATPLVPADHTFSSAVALDLGDRQLELIHPGRGHTAGDLVVRIPDADVLLAGDLIEESGFPAYGEDSYPLDWPLTLDLVIGLLSPDSVVVPGHGAPVGYEFVTEQRGALGVVAETIRDLATRGIAVADALASAEWPYPTEHLGVAVRRGYAHLPLTQRRLPLV